MNKKKILLVVFILNMGITLMAASDSLQKVSLSSFELVRLQNIWLNTSNPAAFSQMGDLLPGIFNANYLIEDGKYKRIQQGDKLNQFSFNTLSYAKVKNFNMYGGFNYEKGKEKGLDFSNVNDPFRMSPYHLIDTLGNDNYDREFFSVAAGISTPIGVNLTFGLGLDFKVGLSVQDIDPRPLNKVFHMTVSPGFIYNMGKFELGLNLLYKYYNEEIEISIIRDNTDATFFSTHGLGLAISHRAENFNRLQKRNTRGFDFQLAYSNANLKSLIGSTLLFYKETNGDGRKASNASWSSIKDDSKLNGIQFDLYNHNTITKENQIEYFGCELNLNTMTGIEIIQHLELIPGNTLDNWVTYGEEEKYGATDLKMKIFYEYHKLKNLNERNFAVKAFFSYHSFDEKYYIPMQKQNFKNMKMGVAWDKSFSMKKGGIFSIGLGLNYKFNINGELDLSDYTFIAEKILAPDYEFLTDKYYAPRVELAIEIPMKKVFDQYFIKSSVECFKGDNGQSRTIFNISTGVTF